MNRISVKVEGVSKTYTLGVARNKPSTLADVFRNALRTCAKTCSKTLRPQSGTSSRISPSSVIPVSQPPVSPVSKNVLQALENVSFDLRTGDILGVIGRNGAGKSTLLKIMARITEPTSGTIQLHGTVGSLLEVGTGFHPELTGLENIYLNGAILGMSKGEIERHLPSIAAYAEVEDFLNTPVKRYSSGMYLRLAFAVAAHLSCEILLLDEVLAVGDAGFQQKCLQTIIDVTQKGRSVILVSHNILSVRQLCNKAIWLERGKVMMYGPASDVCNAYLDIAANKVPVAKRQPKDVEDSAFYFSSAELLDTNGAPCVIFNYGDTMVINLTTSGESPEPYYSAEYRIRDSLGQLISVGASGPHHGLFFDRAASRVRIAIGPLTLTHGRYTLSFSLMAGNHRADSWDGVLSFTLEICQPYARIWNICSPTEGVCIQATTFEASD